MYIIKGCILKSIFIILDRILHCIVWDDLLKFKFGFKLLKHGIKGVEKCRISNRYLKKITQTLTLNHLILTN